MKIDRLTYAAQCDLLSTILRGLERRLKDQMDEELLTTLLEGIVPLLDDLDWEGAFGTEGWQHDFGVED